MRAADTNTKEPTKRYWHTWYLLVAVVLVVEILAFVWLTNRFK